MNKIFRLKPIAAALVAVNWVVPLPTFAQAIALEEVIVTARRKDENIQEVPISVNSLTDQQLNDLNIRNFEDVESAVAGLSLQGDSIAPNAALRGIRFDTFTGSSPTVEFYLNDSISASPIVMQNLFDIQSIEVLRGPQGTLRGRASPSGSITVTTARAETDIFTGFVDTTFTDDGDENYNAAVNIPLIENKLGVRLAGFWEENDINDVSSVYTGEGSHYEGNGWRVTLGAEPTDNLSIQLMYQDVEPTRKTFLPVESAYRANNSLAVANPDIEASDRKSVQDVPELADQRGRVTVLNLSWDINDQHQMNYVGSYSDLVVERTQPTDVTNAIDETQPAGLQGTVQDLYTDADFISHELRFQSTDPLFGKLDYVVGGFYMEQISNVQYVSPNLLPFGGGTVFNTSITSEFDGKKAKQEEESYFLNLTYHLSDETEFSAGARQIYFDQLRFLAILPFAPGGNPTILSDAESDDGKMVYSFQAKHNFTYDTMGYFTWGTSWRAGPSVVGDRSLVVSATQDRFTNLPPEESESFELGVKTSWLDQRLRVNGAVYHQTFDNYPYRPVTDIYYQSFSSVAGQLVPSVARHNFVAPVPVEVNGIELDINYLATDALTIGALVNYSKGEIDNGEIACNDYLPNDGKPDSGGVPTLGDIQAAAGAENLTTCQSSQRTNFAPDLSATLSAEYVFPIGALDAYVRGLWSIYDKTENDPTNAVDDIDAYSILNLYVGVRDMKNGWEAMLYAKNVADAEEVLTRESDPGSVSYAVGGTTLISDYREVSLTAPREIGLNLRYNF